MKPLTEIHNFWKNAGGRNAPEKYLIGDQRTKFLVQKISETCSKSNTILEIGCNVGRNLNGLFHAGYKNLIGIEINHSAIVIMQKEFPEMYSKIEIYNTPVEKILHMFEENSIDIVFTMAVLEHIHPDSEKIVFENIKRIARKNIITIEDEGKISDRHCPRNYENIFESEKFGQFDFKKKLNLEGLSGRYIYRLFKKRTGNSVWKTEGEQQFQADMLAQCNTVLKNNGIQPILTGSALLGAYRDGDFIPWAWGTVLLVTDYDNLIKIEEILKHEFVGAGFEIHKHFKKRTNWKITVKKLDFVVEITGFFRDGKHFKRIPNKNRIKTIPKKYLQPPFMQIEIRGNFYNAPFKIEKYLKHLYGKNWKTPVQSRDRKKYRNPKFCKKAKRK